MKTLILISGAIVVVIGLALFSGIPNILNGDLARNDPNDLRTVPLSGSSAQLAVISETPSPNFPGYDLVLNGDGSGSVQFKGNPDQVSKLSVSPFPAGTFDVDRLRELLNSNESLENIRPSGGCSRPPVFSSVVTLTRNGRTTGDLKCISENDPQVNQDISIETSRIQIRLGELIIQSLGGQSTAPAQTPIR